jgi:hypothetical protein
VAIGLWRLASEDYERTERPEGERPKTIKNEKLKIDLVRPDVSIRLNPKCFCSLGFFVGDHTC